MPVKKRSPKPNANGVRMHPARLRLPIRQSHPLSESRRRQRVLIHRLDLDLGKRFMGKRRRPKSLKGKVARLKETRIKRLNQR